MNREMIIKLDGIPTTLKAPDLNKDGKVGGVEDITQQVGPQIISQINPTELGDTLKELNRDDLDPNTNMSGIDMRSIIHPLDITNIAAFDSLVWLDFLSPKSLAVTRKMLRLSVSQDGKGREHMVDVATGKRMFDAANGGTVARVKNFLGMNKEDKVEK
ncbi:hypothetical protein LCGC14_1351240 [marine sediment metagenome]|uniref:Uncharacterized protein n=1 Tax=marine sediment metagenome TaxID=412755 RepID=A0A0F9MRN0_9ZZZZ